MSHQMQKSKQTMPLFLLLSTTPADPAADSFEKRLVAVMNAERESRGDDVWAGRATSFAESMLRATRLSFPVPWQVHDICVDTQFVASLFTLSGLLVGTQALAERIKRDESDLAVQDQITECKSVLEKLRAQLRALLPGFNKGDTTDQTIGTVISYRECLSTFESGSDYSYEAITKALDEVKKRNDVEKVVLYDTLSSAIKHVGFLQTQITQPIKEVERAYYREKAGLKPDDVLPDEIEIMFKLT